MMCEYENGRELFLLKLSMFGKARSNQISKIFAIV